VWSRWAEPLRQPRAQALGDIGHQRKIGDALKIDPVPELLRPHLLLRRLHPDGTQRLGQLRARQADQRWLRQRDAGFERRLFERNTACVRLCDVR